MKPVSAISIYKQPFIALVLIFVLLPSVVIPARPVLQPSGGTPQATAALPQPVSPSTSGCQWTYYPIKNGKLQPEQLLYNDPDNTPIANLSVGSMFKGKAAALATTGSTDFNGDNKTDVFRTLPRTDGNLQWQYSSGGTTAWQNLAYASSTLPTSALKFGEFSKDNLTDVFAVVYNNTLLENQWLYSPGGSGSFVTLNSIATYPDLVALGDFNGDGVTDVFTATLSTNGEQWAYYPGGSGAAVNLAYAGTDPNLFHFGDFNGDGKTDVFAGARLPDGSVQWMISSGGAASYTNLSSSSIPYSELQFGDFDGDGKTDVLVAQPQSDGSLQVIYWPGGLGSGVTLGSIPAPAPALRVGDFNGDGISDLMAYRCGMQGPLSFSPLQTLAQSGFNGFNHILSGDVNGDGLSDVILASTCQNPDQFGSCASNHLEVGVALQTPSHSYSLVAPVQLGSSSIDFSYYKILPGDFDGDGKTDLALVYPGATTLTIYMAHGNGDGTFTLGPVQTFGGETWSDFNPTVGDFNGDGKADLAFTTVCIFSNNSCTDGNTNSVYIATSHGTAGFTLGPRQNLSSSTGWEDFITVVGDFNGDGKADLVFNSTCQKNAITDSTCTAGDANLVYTAISNGTGGLTLSPLQTYGASGWSDYSVFSDLAGDVNGDGRADLVWSSGYQSTAQTHNNLVVVGLANPDGTFQLGSTQNFGSQWSGRLTLADVNQDGKADLIWNNASYGNTDLDTYAAATSNGSGTFTLLGQGSVYTGQGIFNLPETDAANKLPTSLPILSTRQDSISDALFIIDGFSLGKINNSGNLVYLPFLQK